MRTRAELDDGVWRINGQKMWISLGNVAEVALVFAQTDPEKRHRGHRLLPGAHLDRGLLLPGDPRQARAAGLRHRARWRFDDARGARGRAAGRGRRRLQDRDDGARLRPLLGRRRVRRDLRGLRPGLDRATRRSGAQFGVPIASFQLVQEMIAEHGRAPGRGPAAGPAGRDPQGPGQAEHGRDVDRQALRDRVGGRVREPGDPGARRLRLRRRLPGRALPARRPRHHPLRGHLADPEADHRPRGDRDQRDDSAFAPTREPARPDQRRRPRRPVPARTGPRRATPSRPS